MSTHFWFTGGRSLIASLVVVVLALVALPAPASADQPANDDSVTTAEKKWCLTHAAFCIAAWAAKGEAEDEAKKLYPEFTLGDGAGDAFRHCYWSGLMTLEFGGGLAKTIGDKHEDRAGNPPERAFMDKHNNSWGRKWANENRTIGGKGKVSKLCQAGTEIGAELVYLIGYHVWEEGTGGLVRILGYRQWAMTRFTAHQPLLRSVEVKISGPATTDLIVYRQPAYNQWQEVAATRNLSVAQAGHTKFVFDPPVPITVGERLYLQVFNREQTPMSVYFSPPTASAELSYLWRADSRAAASAFRDGDMNAIVYGWPHF